MKNPGNTVVERTLRLNRLGAADVELVPERTPRHPMEFGAASSNALIHALLGAERARQHAASYREFLVGAAAVAYYHGPHGTRKLTVAHGANMKPVQGSDIINVHAEHVVMTKINIHKREDESVYVPALAVVGDLQPDQQSGEETLTLHPCGVCRDAFNSAETPIDIRTLIVTANPSFTALEWFSLDALTKVHEQADYSSSGSAVFDVRSPILTPVELEGRRYVRPSDFDTPEMDAAEDAYDARVKLPVMNYVARMIAAGHRQQPGL